MRKSTFLISATFVVLFSLMANSSATANTPQRVVSLDYCADQFVLKLLPRSRILALSPDADRNFSYMRDAATGLPQVRPVAENVLVLQPDLIIRSYGGGPNAANFFQRAGIPVLQVPFANNLDDIRAMILMLADRLGAPERGAEIVADMDRRLEKLRTDSEPRSALYMTPTGVTSGPNTLVHEMLHAANLENFEQRPGWYSLPLERLAYEQPDLVAAAFFDAGTDDPSMWSAMRHPVAQRQLSERPTVMLRGAWTSCGGWFLLDAIEALAAL
jgi:iron complex transport system substrate-binding protein